MKLKSLGNNMTEVDTGKYRVLFSYETPVAAIDNSGKALKTSKKFSSTTTRHISKFLGSDAKTAEEKPQEFFDTLTESNIVASKLQEIKLIESVMGTLDSMGTSYALMENFDGDKEINESDDKCWYVIDRNNIIYSGPYDQQQEAVDSLKSGDFQNEDDEELEVVFGYEDSDGLFSDKPVGMDETYEELDIPDEDMNESEGGYGGDDFNRHGNNSERKLKGALRFLNQLIDGGAEFPDASSKAAMKFDVSISELTDAYDNQDLQESSLNESSGGKNWAHEDVIDSRDIIERIEELEGNDDLDESEQEELAMLKNVAEEGEGYSDWEHGETLINTNYWVEYCKELVSDIGDLPRDLPSYIEIDWERTASNLEVDYSTIDIGNSEFYIRS